jgi:hypothetical protein
VNRTLEYVTLYINDFPLNVQRAELVLFADDTNLLVTGKDKSDLQLKIKNLMQDLQIWFYKNYNMINTGKTIAISFHTKQKRYPLRPLVTFKNMNIACKSEFKLL